MLVLDSNHLQELGYRGILGLQLEARLQNSGDDSVTTVVCAEESLRGRMARLASVRDVGEQVRAYRMFAQEVGFLGRFTLLPWNESAASRFKDFRAQGIRIGTMDLRIACITMEYGGLLLTRNTVDFAQVPRLRFENWLG